MARDSTHLGQVSLLPSLPLSLCPPPRPPSDPLPPRFHCPSNLSVCFPSPSLPPLVSFYLPSPLHRSDRPFLSLSPFPSSLLYLSLFTFTPRILPLHPSVPLLFSPSVPFSSTLLSHLFAPPLPLSLPASLSPCLPPSPFSPLPSQGKGRQVPIKVLL